MTEAAPRLDFVGTVEPEVAAPLLAAGATGERRNLPILGGRVSGPRLINGSAAS